MDSCPIRIALRLPAALTTPELVNPTIVWANARDAALRFYERHGFAVHGDGFVDATTQLPHHVVVRRMG